MNLNTKRLESRVARARKALGRKVTYRLGRGGYNGKFPSLVDWDDKKSDCSGFVSWVLCMRRDQIRAKKWWSRLFPWIETTAIRKDAIGPQRVFVQIDEPVPGCLVVYGDSGGSQGHIGVVTQVDDYKTVYVGGAMRTHPGLTIIGIDCSSGMSKRTGEAIHERDLSFFLSNPKTIFCVLREDLVK